MYDFENKALCVLAVLANDIYKYMCVVTMSFLITLSAHTESTSS